MIEATKKWPVLKIRCVILKRVFQMRNFIFKTFPGKKLNPNKINERNTYAFVLIRDNDDYLSLNLLKLNTC